MPRSPLASPSATIAVLRRHGLYTRKSLGQHFLVDDNVISRILDLAGVRAGETVLEIGAGIGTLTAALCGEGALVVAVEKDRSMLPALAELTDACQGLRIVNADALEVLPDQLDGPGGPPTALVANLPYGVAATVVLRSFETLPTLATATVMVQAEVADRMMATPGGKDYGAYTVKLRLLAQPAGRFGVAPACFLPPPRVDSAVLRLERVQRQDSSSVLRDAAAAADAAFSQRRKTLRNSLSASLPATTAAIEEALAEAGIDPGRRAETLDVGEYLTLGAVLRARALLP